MTKKKKEPTPQEAAIIALDNLIAELEDLKDQLQKLLKVSSAAGGLVD